MKAPLLLLALLSIVSNVLWSSAAPLTADPRYTHEQWVQKCRPHVPWMVDYVEWHRAERLKNSQDTKYTVYSCPGVCQGLGDRLRGIMTLVRVAAASKRVFLIYQQKPAPMEAFLPPSGILDWVVHGTPPPRTRDTEPDDQWVPAIKSGAYLTLADKYMLHQNFNEYADLPVPGAPNVTLLSEATHCLFHALFRPAAEVAQMANKQMTALGVAPGVPFTAMHLRLGGMVGETNHFFWDSALPAVLSAIACGRELQAQQGAGGTPHMVLLTDHAILRQFVSSGVFAGVTATPLRPNHFGTANLELEKERGLPTNTLGIDDAIMQRHWATVADMAVLGQATCLVASDSGFSNAAAWWSGTTCVASLQQCMRKHWKLAHTATQTVHRRLTAAADARVGLTSAADVQVGNNMEVQQADEASSTVQHTASSTLSVGGRRALRGTRPSDHSRDHRINTKSSPQYAPLSTPTTDAGATSAVAELLQQVADGVPAWPNPSSTTVLYVSQLRQGLAELWARLTRSAHLAVFGTAASAQQAQPANEAGAAPAATPQWFDADVVYAVDDDYGSSFSTDGWAAAAGAAAAAADASLSDAPGTQSQTIAQWEAAKLLDQPALWDEVQPHAQDGSKAAAEPANPLLQLAEDTVDDYGDLLELRATLEPLLTPDTSLGVGQDSSSSTVPAAPLTSQPTSSLQRPGQTHDMVPELRIEELLSDGQGYSEFLSLLTEESELQALLGSDPSPSPSDVQDLDDGLDTALYVDYSNDRLASTSTAPAFSQWDDIAETALMADADAMSAGLGGSDAAAAPAAVISHQVLPGSSILDTLADYELIDDPAYLEALEDVSPEGQRIRQMYDAAGGFLKMSELRNQMSLGDGPTTAGAAQQRTTAGSEHEGAAMYAYIEEQQYDYDMETAFDVEYEEVMYWYDQFAMAYSGGEYEELSYLELLANLYEGDLEDAEALSYESYLPVYDLNPEYYDLYLFDQYYDDFDFEFDRQQYDELDAVSDATIVAVLRASLAALTSGTSPANNQQAQSVSPSHITPEAQQDVDEALTAVTNVADAVEVVDDAITIVAAELSTSGVDTSMFEQAATDVQDSVMKRLAMLWHCHPASLVTADGCKRAQEAPLPSLASTTGSLPQDTADFEEYWSYLGNDYLDQMYEELAQDYQAGVQGLQNPETGSEPSASTHHLRGRGNTNHRLIHADQPQAAGSAAVGEVLGDTAMPGVIAGKQDLSAQGQGRFRRQWEDQVETLLLRHR